MLNSYLHIQNVIANFTVIKNLTTKCAGLTLINVKLTLKIARIAFGNQPNLSQKEPLKSNTKS